MNVTGLITEYNPFHNGHIYHIKEARKKANSDVIVAIMSGNFTQRGEASITNKFIRAQEAIKYVDLVVELPVLNAVSFSDDFALGGVHIATLLNVDTLVFGSESGDVNDLYRLYGTVESLKDSGDFHSLLRQGYSYPRAISTLSGSSLTEGSNNMLGLSYIKAIDTLDAQISAETIPRIGNDYNDPELSGGSFSSATSLRKRLLEGDVENAGQFMPASLVKRIHRNHKVTNEDFFKTLKTLITHKSDAELREIYMMTEGLEHRLKTHIREARSYHEFLSRIKTKRYTWTRLGRLLAAVLLNITQHRMDNHDTRAINHFRVLAMNETGQKYLKTLPASVTRITNVNKENRDFIRDEITATDIYNTASGDKAHDFNTPVIIQR